MNTCRKIVNMAFELLLSQGIKKTSMEDVARAAGVTRMTVYRCFGGKQELVAAAFNQVLEVLAESLADVEQAGESLSVPQQLERITRGFAALPQGDLPARLQELQRVYPFVWEAFHTRRKELIGELFNCLFEQAARQGVLRPGLRPEVVQAYFSTAVVNVLQDPQLVSLKLGTAEIFETVKDIFLFGLLNETPQDEGLINED